MAPRLRPTSLGGAVAKAHGSPDMTGKARFLSAAVLFAVLTSTASVLSLLRVARSTPSNEPAQVARSIPSRAPPIYRSSVTGTDFDFITDDDPSAFDHLEYVGLIGWVMRDKRISEKWVPVSAYVFDAFFKDGTKIKIALHYDYGSKEAAETDSLRYAPPLGRLPTFYRQNIKHLNVQKGGPHTTAHTKSEERTITIYSENATKRISTHDLEETLFHEASHSIQNFYLMGAAWKEAKEHDNAYITEYARTNDQEDFAESALFAYTLIYHPERLPAAEREKIEKQIPNRIAFFRSVYTGQPTPPVQPTPPASPPPAASSDPP
jgi:hypothetical protein